MYYENTARIIGCLGADPEIRSFQNGGKVANLRIATTRRWKNQAGEVKEETEWHSVAVTADGLVRLIEGRLKKGAYVMVQGRLRTRKWQDQNGQDRYSTEILVAPYGGEIGFLDRNPGGGSQGGGYDRNPGGGSDGGPAGPGGGRSDYDDEIPF